MTRIGLISDTHGYLDENVFKHFDNCNEIWHAGDFGRRVFTERYVKKVRSKLFKLFIKGSDCNVGIGTETPSQKLQVIGNICATGSIGSCSDIRYKKNIQPLSNALNSLLTLHGIYYHWDKEKFAENAFTDERQMGFSAQEIEKLFPEIVQTDAKGCKAVDYGRLTPVFVEALREQQKQMDDKQSQIENKQQQIDELKSRLDKLEKLIVKQ